MSTRTRTLALLCSTLLAGCVADADGDGWSAKQDCDDDNAAIHPNAPEICDGLDNDCDEACADAAPDGSVAAGGAEDCDDEDPTSNPAADEICDDIDHDCDGATWDGPVFTWWADADGDTYGTATDVLETCDEVAPDGYVAAGEAADEDCDDANADEHPGADEVCDADDDDCDGEADEGFDADDDGVTTCGPDGVADTADDDCDDADAARHPGHAEVCDGADNDCDEEVDGDDADYAGEDFDGDGDLGPACGGLDCDDTDPTVHSLDADGDGQTSCGSDCDDDDPIVNGLAAEICDGVDTDCDGVAEADETDVPADHDGDGVDSICAGGADCDDRDPHVFPAGDYTSGPVRTCRPVVYPGYSHEWHFARASLPSLFVDAGGDQYLYFRGHEDQEEQAIGYAVSTDGGTTWSDAVGPILEDTGDAGGWDARNLSNPSVVRVPGLARDYVMLYHARDASSGVREIGLASATSPEGPFERLDPGTGDPLTDPVLGASSVAGHLDNDRTLHPSAFHDPSDGLLHAWYNGRSDADSILRVFHATSADGGVTWSRDGVPIFEPVEAWEGDRVTQVSWLVDPLDPDAFELWYTGADAAVGLAYGDYTTWTRASDDPVFEAHTDCHRFDGAAVAARGIRHDDADDAYHWYYGAQTSTDPDVCADNEDGVYTNFGQTVNYVGYAVNHAPEVTAFEGVVSGADVTFAGEVSDSAPDLVVIALTSDVDGFLGNAAVDSTGNTDPDVQSTTWILEATGLGSGTHDVLVEAIDEGGVRRTDFVVVTVP